MLVVSALGANARSPFFYNRVKGEMENALMEQEWERLTIVRPSMLLGNREKHRVNESLFAPLFRIMPGNLKSIAAQDVASAMLKAAFSPFSQRVEILSSARLRAMASD